jgi:hypothetical protein
MTTTKTSLYSCGFPFDPLLHTNLEKLNFRVQKEKKAGLIIISGGVGLGKTTLLTHVLDDLNKINDQPPIEFDGCQLAMGGVDFLKKLRLCFDEKKVCMGYDEAGDFSKRGSLTSFNAMLNRTFETFRAFKCIVVLALPNFNVLDNQLFDNQIPRMLIHVTGRNMKYGDFAVYDLMNMNWLRYWMKKSAIKDYAWGRVHPNFRGHFLDLPPERSKQLDEISTTNKLKILRKSEVKVEGLLTKPEIAQKLDVSVHWVTKALNNLKIKNTRRIEHIGYYDQTIVARLSEHLDNTAPIGRPRTRGI